jgi:hypothetical protein
MNTGDALQYINGLHALGVGLAVDRSVIKDIGTGAEAGRWRRTRY